MSVSLRRATLAAVLAAATGLALVAAPAANAARVPHGTAGLSAALPNSGGLHADANLNTNFGAGYFVYPDDGIASVTATFRMPAITCNRANDSEWLLPGIWMYSQGALSQQVDVNFNCNNGVLLQESVVCLAAGCATSIPIAPGDKIRASIAYTSTATIGTIRDLTQGTVSQYTDSAIATDDVAFVGDEGPSLFLSGAVTHVPTFSSVNFSEVAFNGDRLVDGPSPTPYNLRTNVPIQITTGAIKANGEAFVTNFKNN